MTRLNAHFQLKAFHYWIQWCHRPAQFSLNSICNQVGDIAGNEVSPTKQARGDNSKEPKIQSMKERRKKPWEKPGSVGGAVPFWSDEQ